MDLSGYTLVTLHQDTEFVLCRGRATANPTPQPTSILVSMPTSEQPAPDRIRMLEHELALRSDLDSTWAVRPLALAQYQGRAALILEDQPGDPLEQLLGKSPVSNARDARGAAEPALELGLFLKFAVGLATALGQAHRRGIIHKDVKPTHFLVNPSTGQAWLTGFGIASRLPRERQTPNPPETIAGTLAYMAPEQTGRMNRSIDCRSDLYALGVTLYQMLIGSLPFTASDPIEWVHCHVARKPADPVERVADIPAPVSAIIMKLLAKRSEERYQTATGLERDLRRCFAQWEAERRIDDFPIGEHDTPDRLLIPENLYGRAREVETLLAAFDRVVQTGVPELVLVSGHSGVGKSSVVNELYKILLPPDALFAAGKFHQQKRDIPYSTIAQAFQHLIRPLFTKSEDELGRWRRAFRDALGPNGQLMVDLVPELKVIVGEQPAVHDLPPQDAQRRFQLVFRRFLGVFARPEHPLALFLDDWQWLDAATLDLLQDLITQADVRHLLLIGAYRDNEVTPAHPLTRRLEAIRSNGVPVQEIGLAPLGRQDVCRLIEDSLYCDGERAAPLAQLVHEKTAGNPFFAIQFLSALVEEGLVTFDHAETRWRWDLKRIHAKGYTDNVIDLMVGTLNRLSADTQRALRHLACLGNSADFAVLAMVYENSKEELDRYLQHALRAGLVFRSEGAFRFLHDRVQEAAYSLIPEAQRAEVHLRIGRLLLAHTPPGEREDAIFEIVNQLNRGAALIGSRDERELLAELNLIAGRRAKGSAAFASALAYFASGVALLTEDCWERRHDLAFALELNRAECEYSTGQPGPSEEHLSALAPHADAVVERAAIACLRMDLCHTQAQQHRAIGVGLDFLRDVGVEWSPHPSEEELRREYERIGSQLGPRAIEDLIDLPVLSDSPSLATLDVLAKLAVPAHATDNNLHGLVNCRAVSLSIERGNCEASCYAYVWLGAIAGAQFGDYQAGYRFARVGFELGEQRGWKSLEPATCLVFGSVILPWARHVRDGRDLIRRAIESATSIGDLHFAVGSGPLLNTNMLAVGDQLADVQRVIQRHLELSLQAGFGLSTEANATQLAFVRTLRGMTPTFGCLDGHQFEEEAAERRFAGNPNLQHAECWYWIRKLQARFLAGDYAAAITFSLRAEPLLWTAKVVFEAAEYHLYSALSRAACCDTASRDGRQQHLEAMALHQRQLDIWARNCPENFENRAWLVGAEIARIEGRELDAERLYEDAIRSARENEFVHNEALANELAARFYAARGFHTIAHAYLRNARYGYLRWGADGKVRQLDQRYSQLTMEEAAPVSAGTIDAPLEQLDLATVVKVSQAVSGEMVLEKLLDTLMRTAIEYAGAERAVLILSREAEPQIVAAATTDINKVVVELLDQAVTASVLPETILRHVRHTHESVILDDATVQNPFSTDPYIGQRLARSVLCLPLENQAKLIGVLYLENNLAPHVFAPARTAVLKLLASQAAISLENSRLYRDLAEREAKVRRLGDANIIGICMWDLDGRILQANDAFLGMVGYHREDLISGRVRWTDLTPAEWRDRDESAMAELQATGSVQPYEKEIFRKDGRRVPVLVGGALFEEGGNDGVAFVLDLTGQKHADAEIRALKDQLYRENLALRDEVDRASMFEEIVGASPTLKAVLSRIAKVAPTDSTVFISGETGTGKELIARAVHKRSHRTGRAFVSVNCAALAPTLISSELFGSEKGAFTGATQRRLGRFELADGGTIFLDEVGELLPDTQVTLLRVLQEREFERVGGTQPIHVDVRVIAATNRDLKAAIAEGSFRQDLYYRLNVFPIEVPPLRQRKDDLLMLVEYFVQRYASRAGKQIRSIEKKTLDLLQAYDWPGNIRELQNVIERSVILSSGDVFAVDELWLSAQSFQPTARTTPSAAFHGDPQSEREIIEAALAESRGRIAGPSGAAAKLNIPPSTLEHRIKALKIRKSQFKFR